MAYNAVPNKPNQYKQGKYKPINESKYVGDITNAWFRSGLEYKAYTYLDKEPKVKKWGAEIVSIPYAMPSLNFDEHFNLKLGDILKEHTYHVDIYAEIYNDKRIEGIDKLLIEVKPHKEYMQIIQGKPPQKPIKMTPSKMKSWKHGLTEYIRNTFKWKYAQKYAQARGMKFVVLTEEVLKQSFIL